MAQNTFLWNNFTGGQSDDDYMISKGQFAYSENIDVKNTGFEIGLTSKPVKQNFVNQEIKGFLPIENTSGVKQLLYYGTSGKVFKNTSADNTPEFTVTGGQEIWNAVEFNGYIYFFSHNSITCAIYRDTKANIIAGSYAGATFTPIGPAIPTPGFSNISIIVREKIYAGIGKSLYSIDSIGTGVNLQTFNDDIIGITTIANLFKIYLRNGDLYYVSYADGSIQEYKELGLTIRNVLQVNGIDYILAGNSQSYSELYYMNGTIPTIIRRAKKTIVNYPMGTSGTLIENNKNNFGYYISQHQDDIILVDYGANYARLCHYGNINDIFPKVFSNIVTINSQNVNCEILGPCVYWNQKLYYYYSKSGGNSGVDYINLTTGSPYQVNGYIFTEIFDGGTRGTLKKIHEVIISSVNNTGNDCILSYAIDGGAYTVASTINNGDKRTKITIPREFYYLQFRIELKGSAKLREISLRYEITQNG